ncbi:hypothetical protein HRbin02_01571 [Candidatus Calditenuaceae archaeon HR02]|nr:hypothetical protein HRbin02_01571 [Candidatus Calditenuaceae archaeon HR02]
MQHETKKHTKKIMDVGRGWLENLPYAGVYTAERAAYRNGGVLKVGCLCVKFLVAVALLIRIMSSLECLGLIKEAR